VVLDGCERSNTKFGFQLPEEDTTMPIRDLLSNLCLVLLVLGYLVVVFLLMDQPSVLYAGSAALRGCPESKG